MSRLIPHPVVSLALILMWLMLTRFSLGYLILGTALALLAGWAYDALHPVRPAIRRWAVVPRLVVTLFLDILRSNVAVARLLLTEGRSSRRSAFVEIPLTMRNENALALLAIILTATPGTVWLEYLSDTGRLTLHVFDGAEADYYRRVVKDTYQPMLQEIFE